MDVSNVMGGKLSTEDAKKLLEVIGNNAIAKKEEEDQEDHNGPLKSAIAVVATAVKKNAQKSDARLLKVESAIALVPKQGYDGKAGKDGRDGKDGKDGKIGRDGKDGKDGEDGNEGVSVVDAKVDFDNSLVLTLSNGNEIDAGQINVSGNGASGLIIQTSSGSGGATESGPDFTYTTGQLTRIDYDSGAYKVFTYSGATLTRVDYTTSSGTTRKDFTYNGDGTVDYITQSTL
jgi:hypothetical protein